MVEWQTLVAVVGTVSAVLIAWMGWGRSRSKDAVESGANNATILVELGHIRSGNDDIKSQLKDMSIQMGDLRERVAKIEAKAESAHDRLDIMQGKVRKGEDA